MEGALLLDVIIRERASILKLLASEDKTLLVRWNTLLVLDLRFHVVNCVRRLDFQGDGLPRKGLDENLHTTTQAKDYALSLVSMATGQTVYEVNVPR